MITGNDWKSVALRVVPFEEYDRHALTGWCCHLPDGLYASA
jgi:hypothetical protein